MHIIVYKSVWTLSIGQVLLFQPDIQKEALDYDKYAVDIFKRHEQDLPQLDLVGHAPIESWRLLKQFLKVDLGNSIYVDIIGMRKREVGLVILAKLSAPPKCSRCQRNSPPAQNVIERQKFICFDFKVENCYFIFKTRVFNFGIETQK